MPLLSDAKKLFVGGTSINKVFSNGFVVWPKVTINPDRCIPTIDSNTNVYQSVDLSTYCEYEDITLGSIFYKDFRWLKYIYLWAPKCIDDPTNDYCSPVWRFTGKFNDPQPGYAPGEDWCFGATYGAGAHMLWTKYGMNALAPISTPVSVERFGSQEIVSNGIVWWWYKLQPSIYVASPKPYLCGADERYQVSAVQYQFRLYLKDGPASSPDKCTVIKSGVSCYDGNWIEGGGNPSKGFEKCVDNWNGFTYP